MAQEGRTRTSRLIHEEELVFLKLLDITDYYESSCCSSSTNSEDDAERYHETMSRHSHHHKQYYAHHQSNMKNNRHKDTTSTTEHPLKHPTPTDIIRWKESEKVSIQRSHSEPSNCFPASHSNSKSSLGGGMKQVRWADALVDVHTFMSPRSHVLWKRLRKKMVKAAVAIKQDIEF